MEDRLMFIDSDREFISKNMKIVVASIESKLNESSFIEFKEIAIAAISKYIRAIRDFEASGIKKDLTSFNENQAEKSIRMHFSKIENEIKNNETYQVFDALRHSFSCYAYNGLHQLYTRQENECWHPKILLTEVLQPNDIYSLPEILTIYRGCDIDEFKNISFGQSWSTSLETAKRFAYTHYLGQDWFDEGRRIVLEATYVRDHVLFSDQKVEYEVVVDVQNLESVRIHA